MASLDDYVAEILENQPKLGVTNIIRALKALNAQGGGPDLESINSKNVRAAKQKFLDSRGTGGGGAAAAAPAVDPDVPPTLHSDDSLNHLLHKRVTSITANLQMYRGVEKYDLETFKNMLFDFADGKRISDPWLKKVFATKMDSRGGPGLSMMTTANFLNYLSQKGNPNVPESVQNTVYCVKVRCIDPSQSVSQNDDAKKQWYEAQGAYDPKKGLVMPQDIVEKMPHKYPESFGIQMTSDGVCSFTCTHGLEKIESGQAKCVFALDGTTKEPLKLSIASAYKIKKRTLWQHPNPLGEIEQCRFYVPPIFLCEFEGVTSTMEHEDLQYDMISAPQCDMTETMFGQIHTPVHDILLVVAYDDKDVYAVYVDPSYGQFNPDAVVENYNVLRAGMRTKFSIECESLLCGAPLAFKVGTAVASSGTSTVVEMEKLVNKWIKSNGSLNLDGHSYGLIGGFLFINEDNHVRANSKPKLVIEGLEKKPELNGQEVSNVGLYNEESGRFKVKVGNGRGNFAIKAKNLHYADHCSIVA